MVKTYYVVLEVSDESFSAIKANMKRIVDSILLDDSPEQLQIGCGIFAIKSYANDAYEALLVNSKPEDIGSEVRGFVVTKLKHIYLVSAHVRIGYLPIYAKIVTELNSYVD